MAALLTRQERVAGHEVACVRVAGPNAGHTVIDDYDVEWKLRQIPTGPVIEPGARAVIAAGSEIDMGVLVTEVSALMASGLLPYGVLIDSEATVISDEHKAAEGGLIDRIGSTGKGIGAARADRVMRTAERYGGVGRVDTGRTLRGWLEQGWSVIVEGTQGFGLGLHAGWYPKCTSSDCRAIDFLGMAGLSPWAPYVSELEVWVVLRTLPIRVAGDSGPLAGETSWEALGLAEEHTTVTQKVRRVGAWDGGLARAAVVANGGPGDAVKIALTHADQDPVFDVERYEKDLGAKIALVGSGPKLGDYVFT